jgi:adenylate cyclase
MGRIQTEIDVALQVGDYFRAYDLATSALELDPSNLSLQYTIVLSLARTGANRQARSRLNALLDSTAAKQQMPGQMAEDLAAMDARLLKDLAFERTGPKRQVLAAQSARRYEAAYAIKGGYFPAINAATMWLIADEPEKSRAMAQSVLADTAKENGYWPLASAAEAHLLLGKLPEARKALASAMAFPGADWADKAVTRRQVALLCDKLEIARSSIDAQSRPMVIHYCGDDERSPDDAGSLDQEIDRLTSDQAIVSAFGIIRNEAELKVTEELLARKIDVSLVLPLGPKALAAAMGDNRGGLLHRLEACIGQLRDPPLLMGLDGPANDALFALSGRCAMGLAAMRADLLMTDVRPIVLRRRHAVPCDRLPPGYEIRTLVFCDIKGFSKVPEQAMPAFVELVLGGLAEEIGKYSSEVEYRETAGDGLYIVFRGVVAAANCALALAARIDRLPPSILPPLGIRVSAHVGAVFPALDPVTGLRKFFGTEVIRAARIEPITPVGECYVTEQFASILVLEGANKFNCDYAGVLESAKGYGAFRMYSLRRRHAVEYV